MGGKASSHFKPVPACAYQVPDTTLSTMYNNAFGSFGNLCQLGLTHKETEAYARDRGCLRSQPTMADSGWATSLGGCRCRPSLSTLCHGVLPRNGISVPFPLLIGQSPVNLYLVTEIGSQRFNP